MTNPENALGTNGAFGGRTSVNAFNDVLSAFRDVDSGAGIISGWEAEINDGQQLELGGKNGVRDVAVAEDPSGNLTTINNISGVPIALDLPAPPVAGTRYDMVVAYVVNPPQGTATVVDNSAACGLIVVDGGVDGMLSSGADALIRQSITQDGAAGTTAYYVVLCEIYRYGGQIIISPGNVRPGKDRNVGGKFPITAQNFDWSTFGSKYTKNTTSTGTVANGSYKTAASLTLDQPGTYILFANSRAEFLGGTYQNFYMRITDRSGNVLSPQTGFYGGQQGGALGQFTISAIGEVTITSPTTINSQVTATGSSGGFANHNSLAAIRVA